MAVLDDIELDWLLDSIDLNDNLAPLSVLSMSFGYSPAGLSAYYLKRWGAKLNKLSALGMVLVCSAGNEATVSDLE